MFLAKEDHSLQEKRIAHYLSEDPPVAMIVAATFFEWTASRTVMFLSYNTNKALHERMKKVHGLKEYKKLWNEEVRIYRDLEPLSQLVRNWNEVCNAFQMRHRIVHGRDRCTKNMARPYIKVLIEASVEVRKCCEDQGFTFTSRLPIRRKKKII